MSNKTAETDFKKARENRCATLDVSSSHRQRLEIHHGAVALLDSHTFICLLKF